MRSTSFQFKCQNDFIVCREKINKEKENRILYGFVR